MEAVGDLAHNCVVLVQDDDVAPGALCIEPVNGGHLDAEVDQPELLGSLDAEDVVGLDHCDALPLAAVVLGDEALHPGFTRARRRDHHYQVVLVRETDGCDSCLILTVMVALHLLAHLFRHVDDCFERHHLLETLSHVLEELYHSLCPELRLRSVLLACLLLCKDLPLC